MDRDKILKQVLEYCKTQATKDFEYVYAFGMLSVMLNDSQLKQLERITK